MRCADASLTLSREQRPTLEARARPYTLPSYQVVRARLVVCAAEGRANDEVAQARGSDDRAAVIRNWTPMRRRAGPLPDGIRCRIHEQMYLAGDDGRRNGQRSSSSRNSLVVSFSVA